MIDRKHLSSNHELSLHVGEGLWLALQEQSNRTGDSISHLVRQAIIDSLDLDHNTIYQVSTSGALVQGVYQGCVKVGDVCRHGDFGLGTFEDLDGEGIMFEGTCWQAKGDGSVKKAPHEAMAPFWTTTFFQADQTLTFHDVVSWSDLIHRLDQHRNSANIFSAIRVHGVFQQVDYRVACKAEAGASLVEATSHQAEYQKHEISGTLIGFWTPTYARTINVPGYHLHLLSDDKSCAGHVLDVKARELKVDLHNENQVKIVLPETAEFLKADLTGDPAAALEKAEGQQANSD